MLGVVLAAALLASCQGFVPPIFRPTPTQATLTPTPSETPPALGEATATPGVTPLAPGTPVTLTIWVPPQFDPGSGQPAGNLFKARLDQFSEQHPGVTIQVRLKALAGAGGLLESLSVTSAAAPGALPDLIILSREDLEIAALKGLLTPLDGLTQAPDDPDWYNFARRMGLLQGTDFGLPLAGDALVLLYRPAQAPGLTSEWPAILRQPVPLSFPAADPNALLTLALYQSAGGPVVDTQRRPTLSSDALAQVLELYRDGSKAGVMPGWLTQLESDAQAWEAYQDGRSQMVVTWISRYLADLPADTMALPLPSLGEQPFTLASGWLLAIPSGHPERRELDVALAEWLVGSEFLGKWTAAAGYLPPRPTSLAVWPSQSLGSLISQVVLAAQVRPTNDVLAALGPVLDDAVQQVLTGQTDPARAAQTAADKLKNP